MASTWHGLSALFFLRAALWLLALKGEMAEAKRALDVCQGNAEALAALESRQNFTVDKINGVGYGFYFTNPTLNPLLGGPNVSRGLVILPERGVSPVAYAPYARGIALLGYYVTIVERAQSGKVLEAMMKHPEIQYWSLAGHGKGGEEAARIAITLQPKVKSLVLIAAPLPSDVDLRFINIFVSVIYGADDTLSTPADVTDSFSGMPGDASVTRFPGFGHYDFAYSMCTGNRQIPTNGSSTVLTAATSTAITSVLSASVEFLQWFEGTRQARSYGDNHYLSPGFNDSKPYPGNILVQFKEVPVPGTTPQRVWWVFTPDQIKGGFIYYTGAAVEGRAYFPLAFEIAARGHLVVIPQQPSRNAYIFFREATAIIDSNLAIFSGVPKKRWAIGGHSLGGVGATTYFACYGNKVYGAVLHAGGWVFNTSMSEVPVLQLYGSIDNAGGGDDAPRRNYLDLVNLKTTTFTSVDGANHYQVGDYGYQTPDQVATISLETQHTIFANATVNFLDSLPTKVYFPVVFDTYCDS